VLRLGGHVGGHVRGRREWREETEQGWGGEKASGLAVAVRVLRSLGLVG